MATKQDLQFWVEEALRKNGGQASIPDIGRHIWSTYASELKRSGDLFFTWQYDIRWAADKLRRERLMKPAKTSPKGIWQLAKGARR